MDSGHVNAASAARLYGLSEKTIRKWIKAGQLPAQVVYEQGVRQYAIAVTDLERLLTTKQGGTTGSTGTPNQPKKSDLTPILERLEHIEQRIVDIERRLDVLEQQARPMMQPARPKSPLPEMRIPAQQVESQESEASESGEKEPLPDGWIGAVAFGKRHGITRDADITGAIRAEKLKAHDNAWKEGRATIKYALDPEQQRKFCIHFAMQQKLKQCGDPDCACYHLGSS